MHFTRLHILRIYSTFNVIHNRTLKGVLCKMLKKIVCKMVRNKRNELKVCKYSINIVICVFVF